MSRASAPFSPRIVLALVAVGALAFVLFLYALGSGWTGGDRSMGAGHAASKGLNGYAALTELLERRGYEISLSRTPGRLDEPGLLVLTPPHHVDTEELDALLEERRWTGPTILVLPKWFGVEANMLGVEDARRNWVMLIDADSPEWLSQLDAIPNAAVAIGERRSWRGMGKAGVLPAPEKGQALTAISVATEGSATVLPLVTDAKGDLLVGYLNDDGHYPALDGAAGFSPGSDKDIWPLVIVAEPDLLNNSGLEDAARARLAVDLVAAAMGQHDLPVVFDLTLAGLGQSENLLTLAFEPPFLAATLMLLLAALVIAWRGFVRFGPPLAERPVLASGKAQLARDAATLIARARRMRLVGPPYARLVAARAGKALGLPERTDSATCAAAIARALERRGEDPASFASASKSLEQARKPADLLRAARALKAIERTLAR